MAVDDTSNTSAFGRLFFSQNALRERVRVRADLATSLLPALFKSASDISNITSADQDDDTNMSSVWLT